jgi:hypothetical protein
MAEGNHQPHEIGAPSALRVRQLERRVAVDIAEQ